MSGLKGVYRGQVVNAADPMQQQRVQIRCDSALGGGISAWAACSLPPGATAGGAGYRVGDKVWIAFENGDANHPVVMGRMGG